MTRICLIVGGIVTLLGVLAGTFGAHGLPESLTDLQREWFETGVKYHMYHGLGLIALAWACDRIASPLWPYIIGMLAAGVVFFSGALYVMAITNLRELGAVAPIGGMCFFFGWALVIYAAWKHRST